MVILTLQNDRKGMQVCSIYVWIPDSLQYSIVINESKSTRKISESLADCKMNTDTCLLNQSHSYPWTYEWRLARFSNQLNSNRNQEVHMSPSFKLCHIINSSPSGSLFVTNSSYHLTTDENKNKKIRKQNVFLLGHNIMGTKKRVFNSVKVMMAHLHKSLALLNFKDMNPWKHTTARNYRTWDQNTKTEMC